MAGEPETNGNLDNLANWWGRESITIKEGSLKRRRFIIRRLKRILPLLGLIVLAIAILYPVLKPQLPTPEWAKDIEKAGTTHEPAMLDLTYRGVNDKGEPFNVTADKAVRNVPLGFDAKKAQVDPMIGLTSPKANLLSTDGTRMDLQAQTGTYDENAKGLSLNGQVVIRNSQGTRLDAPQMSVDFDKNRAWTDHPVQAIGNFGTIAGQGMRMEDGGKTIIFTGQTHGILNSNHPAPDAAASPSQPQPNQP